ncbi:hypothetical protein HK097_001810, partial [Rhizophlyctis rosea]
MPSITTFGFPAHYKNSNSSTSTTRHYHTDHSTDVVRSFAHTAHRISSSIDSINLITENNNRHIRTASAGNGMQVQEDGGLRPDMEAHNGNGIIGADALKGKKRKKDDAVRDGSDADAGHVNGAGTNIKGNGVEHEEKEPKKQKGKRKLVFVDPDEPAAKWWWPGMVISKEDLPFFKRHIGEESFKDPQKGEFIVCYFEDGSYSNITESAARPLCPHLPPYTDYMSGEDRDRFLGDKAVIAATRYWETGEIPPTFTWLAGLEGKNQEKKVKHEKAPSTHETDGLGKKR